MRFERELIKLGLNLSIAEAFLLLVRDRTMEVLVVVKKCVDYLLSDNFMKYH